MVKKGGSHTVWKFHDFYVTHILREIKVGWFRGSKSAILTQLGALNFDFYKFLHLLKFTIFIKCTAPQMAKTADLELPISLKFVLRKIWLTEKTWIFHTVNGKKIDFTFFGHDCPIWDYQNK